MQDDDLLDWIKRKSKKRKFNFTEHNRESR